MLTEKYKDFINNTVNKLIECYEESTGKKYNPNDINSIEEIVNFLNGKIVYVNDLFMNYGINEIVLSKENNEFIIAVDSKVLKKSYLETKKSILKMLYMYINNQIDSDGIIPNCTIIYPNENEHLYQDIMNYINKNKLGSQIYKLTNEIKVFTDEYIKEQNLKINNGIWVKYASEPGNWSDKNANYIKLYNDLKDSGKDWDIAKDINACQNELCGEMIPSEGISSGDIYVYYEKQDNKDVPVFFIKISDLNKDKSYIEYNGTNSVFYGIDSKYISEVIVKLNELDKDKHKKHIDDLKIRYMEYSVLLSLLEKEELEEDEINFIYYMAYKRYNDKAINKIKDRNISEDFKNFSIDAKVRLFKNVTTSENQNNLIIDSKEVISKLAKEGYLNQLNNASKEIIDDREFTLDASGNKIYANGSKMASIPLEGLEATLPPAAEENGEIIPSEATFSIVMWIDEIGIDQTKEDSLQIFAGGIRVESKDGKGEGITAVFTAGGVEQS